MTASVDGTIVFTALESDMAFYHPWTEVIIDISAFADGGSHLLSLDSTTTGPSLTNFFVDAVGITVEPAPSLGDMNCDGAVNMQDIPPFALALTDYAAYQQTHPDCPGDWAGDLNQDAAFNGGDITALVDCLLTGCP